MEELYTTPEVAERFRVSEQTIRDWIRDGKIRRYIRPGRHYLIPKSEVDRLLRESSGGLVKNDILESEDTRTPKMEAVTA